MMRLPALIFGFIMLILFSCSSFAFDVGTNYNSANMSYAAGSTISQYVVLDNTMRSASSITFTVDAHGGGGRPNEHDTGNIRLTFYNSSGGVVYTQQTNYSQNLTQMNAWSTGPGDNSAPWVTLSMTVSSCGGDCSSVAYMKIEMIEHTDFNPETQIRVIGVGGGGGNAVEHMIASGVRYSCEIMLRKRFSRSTSSCNCSVRSATARSSWLMLAC